MSDLERDGLPGDQRVVAGQFCIVPRMTVIDGFEAVLNAPLAGGVANSEVVLEHVEERTAMLMMIRHPDVNGAVDALDQLSIARF